jgi:hypothetical protein|tara:strand:+ start:101 stop:736 length:636 start_codon:yes stop_codon:yes gene_type:complete
MRKFLSLFTKFILIVMSSVLLISCGGWDPQSARKVPVKGPERAAKNVKEGKGVSLRDFTKRGTTTYEFSTSNPMWRAAFDVIDFMPLVTVDYSGGTIITDWYTDNRAPNESLKFTIRFLSSELRADSIKIIIHKKVCAEKSNCVIKKISSKLEDEIRTAIVKRAATFEKDMKENKKVKKGEKKKKGWWNFGNADTADEITKSDRTKRDSGQ